MPLHTIHFMRSINAETLVLLQNVTLCAIKEGATELQIHVSSEGGANDQGFAAYHFLRSLPVPVTMHCIGNVESMAVVMFLAGKRRLIVPEGRIKIHAMHWGFPGGNVDHDRLAEYLDSLSFDAVRYARIFEERTKGAEQILDVREHLAGKARLLNAAAAVAAGIAHEVAEAAIPVAAVKWWV